MLATHAPLITWKDAHMAPTSSGIIHKSKIYRLLLVKKKVDIELQGEWDFSENKNTKFILDNANGIVMFQNAELQQKMNFI